MKLNKYSWLAALPLLFTACQDDMLVEKHSQQEIYSLTATMDGGTNSRAQIVLNGTNTTKETFHWNAGDTFTLFQLADEQNTMSSHQFTISSAYSDETPTASADFTTTSAITAGRNYVAFYPYAKMETYGAPLLINNELDNNTTASWIEYFKNNMFMMAQGTVSQATNMAFKQLCGIIRITYKNESKSDRTFDRIGVNGSWTGGGYYKLPDTENFIGNNHHAGFYGLTFTEKATVKAGKTENFYILYLKNGTTEGNSPMSKVIVDVDLEDKSTTMYSPVKKLPVFETGKCYWLNITDNGKELSWTNDPSSGDEEPEINRHQADVEDFQDLLDALAVNARIREINFMNDIAITEPLTVNNQTYFYMNGHKITLDPSYSSNGMDAVFDVAGRFYVKDGTLAGTNVEKLHDYYFNLNGEKAYLRFEGVELKTGTAIANAIFMDDDNLELNTFFVNKTDSVESSIETSGNAIHLNPANENLWSESRINGNITGNVLIETTFNKLNTYMIFQKGTINGKLTCNVPSGLPVAEYIVRSWENVTIASPNESSWDQAGRYVEDLHEYVDNETELRNAVETAQVSKETTYIYLNKNITLTSPLTIVKPVELHMLGNTLSLSSSFKWGTSEAAILVTTDEVTGKAGQLSIYGKDDWGESTNIGVLQGTTAETGKYLIKNKVGNMWLYNITLSAKNQMNAICVEDSRLTIQGDYSTSINVAEGCYALNMIAQSQWIRIDLQTNINIVGNVGLTYNYSGNDYCMLSYYNDGISSITGNLIKTGTYQDNFRLNLENMDIEGNGWYPEVSSLKEIEEAAKNGNRTLVLKAPLTITDADVANETHEFVDVCLYGTTLLLSDSFDWTNNAAIILSGTKEKRIYGGTIKGSTSETGRYLIQSTSDIFMDDLTLIAESQINAVYVEDSRLNMSQATVESEDGYALDIKASTTSCASAGVRKNSIVKGKVRFENNYSVMPGGDIEPSHFDVIGGMVKGNLTLTGSNTQGLEVIVEEGGSIVGKGWPEMPGVSVPSGNVNNSGTSGNNFGDGGEF